MELPTSTQRNQRLEAGFASVRSDGTYNAVRSIQGTFAWTQFPVITPLPFLAYLFYDDGRLSTAANAASQFSGGAILLELMSSNYAGIRIYDFTLARRDGTGWQHTEARMPQSSSGSGSTNKTLGGYWYIQDAVIAAPAERSLSVSDTWDADRAATAGTAFTISDVLSAAFNVSPSNEPVTVSVSPATADLANATYTYNQTTNAFSIIASAGVYQLVFTASMDNLPGRRAEARLNLTVT